MAHTSVTLVSTSRRCLPPVQFGPQDRTQAHSRIRLWSTSESGLVGTSKSPESRSSVSLEQHKWEPHGSKITVVMNTPTLPTERKGCFKTSV